MYCRALGALQCFALLQAVSAPAQPDSARYQLPATIVNATRALRPAAALPYALSLVELDSATVPQAALSLEEYLRRVPGLRVDNRNNLSQGDRLSLRGLGVRAAFGVRGLKVLLDGIPLTTADGQTQLNNLDLGSMQRVEVLRGPSSALYGNASGGLLSLYTRPPARQPVRLQPRLLAGSDGLWRYQMQLSASSARHRFFASFRGLRSQGYRQHAGAASRGLNAHSRHALGRRAELHLLLNVYDAPYLFNPSSLDRQTAQRAPRRARAFVVGQGAGKKVRQSQGGATLRYRHGRATSELVLYGLSRQLKNPIPGRIIELDRRAGGLRATHARVWKGLDLSGGFDLEWQRDERGEFANEGLPAGAAPTDERLFALVRYGAPLLDQRERVGSFSPFLAVDVPLSAALSLSLSGRLDRYRFEVDDHLLADGDDSGARTMSPFSPLLGLSYRPHPLLALYANYATSFQTPTTTELGNRADGSGGFDPDLEPERVRSLELGGRARHPHWPIDAEWALYQLDIRDMLIAFQVDDPASEETYFRNAGRARNRGFELALSAVPSPRAQLHLAYTFSHFRFVDYLVEGVQLAGREVPGLPAHHLFAEWRLLAPGALVVELDFEWVGRYFANDFNGPPPGVDAHRRDFVNDAYFRADLRLARHLGQGRLFAGIDNLFDARYAGSIVPNAFGNRFFEPAAGRTLYAGAELDLRWGE